MRAVTLTLHPAVDRILNIDSMIPGGTFSAQPFLIVPAGKGVNTSRSLSGVSKNRKIAAAVWIGEDQAGWFSHWLSEHHGIETAAMTRQCTTRQAHTFLEKNGRETHIKELMPAASPREERELLILWSKTVRRGDLVALCGSAPAKTSLATIRKLFEIARRKGASKIIADTNGPALDVAGAAGLDGIKGNAAEIGEWLGLNRPLNLEKDSDRRALLDSFQRRGAAKTVFITLGSKGAAFATPKQIVYAPAPRLPKSQQRAATGCGDAATAGWIWGILEKCSPAETLRRAVACGTAKLAAADPGLLNRALVQKLLRQTNVRVFET